MELFSNQHHQASLLSPSNLPNSFMEKNFPPQQLGEMSNETSYCFPYCYLSEAIPEFSNNSDSTARAYESSSSLDTVRKASSAGTQMSHSAVITVPGSPSGKRRKNRDSTSLCLAPLSNDAMESKTKKQKRPNGGLKKVEEKKPKGDEIKHKEVCGEPHEGYIHVRARRGQATDNHSLAERVRREKINKRMKMLQSLVPGCDRVSGKALMLDEIINYVQSLQNQVEFLSMKLASMNPMFDEFGVDFECLMNHPESMPHEQVPTVDQTNHSQATPSEATTVNYQMVDNSTPILQHGQGPTYFPQEANSTRHKDGT
uniref:BHLH domain-containing protein n=1 Tax=Ananas comosus var. bracteatus TaxID=296719 RepID=A0A6V7NNE0_ANACO|nr:unnamed protein product [Ananas comosus var. bracteatus]